jgi:conserved hypothetical protein
MKILYGVQGTGNGHLSRARALNKYLCEYGIEVDYLFSGRDRANYFDMEEFGSWQCKRGLTFAHQAGKINVWKTLKKTSLRQLWLDINQLDLKPYDIVLTDFEPITAWAARRKGIACIGVGHQYAFDHKVPRRGDDYLGRKIMEMFAPAAVSLGLHWHHFDQQILPPIVDMDATEDTVVAGKILVYLGFESIEAVLALLKPFTDYKFYYYGDFEKPETRGHIELRPLSRDGFKYDLATCEGVISNAGFELSSEAIHLGKKVLVKPLRGQLEQLSNARAMEELKLAMTMDTLESKVTADWLKHFSGRRVVYPNVADAIAQWINNSGWETSGSKEQLIQSLWQAVEAKGVERFCTNPLPPKHCISDLNGRL